MAASVAFRDPPICTARYREGKRPRRREEDKTRSRCFSGSVRLGQALSWNGRGDVGAAVAGEWYDYWASSAIS